MARVYRETWNRPLKPGEVVEIRGDVRTAVIRRRGYPPTRCEVREIGGVDKVVVETAEWYCEWTDATGRQRKRKGYADRRATEAMLAKLVQASARGAEGLAPAGDAGPRRPLGEWLDEYLALVLANGNGDRYRAEVERHCRAAIARPPAGAGWATFEGVTEDSVRLWFGRLRDTPVAQAGGRGKSVPTLNAYRRSLRGFVKWLAEKLDRPDPLRRVKPLKEDDDRRRSALILDDAEFEKLLAAAALAKPTHNTMVAGADRVAIYLTAAFTGLRASELASLTPENFYLAGPHPYVQPAAKSQKARRPDLVPLPSEVADYLRGYLAGKPAGERVWPGDWAAGRRAWTWLARDLRRAGVGTRSADGRHQLGPDGKPYTFHSLRRKFVTDLIRSAVNVDEVRRLARHKNIQTTLDHYTAADLARLSAAAERLRIPAIPGCSESDLPNASERQNPANPGNSG